ncbi:MAG: hypothetical protein KAY24_01030 [Candidatus Eisenbacteria sp.]|nr:hypothetical protein [Candidatus Eisenbacteria bacterium]
MGRVGNERKLRTPEEMTSEIIAHDCYETPPHVTRSLLRREPKLALASDILDPCCGRGAMTGELGGYWPDIFVGDNVRGDLAEITANGRGLYDIHRGQCRIGRVVEASDIRAGQHITGVGGVDILASPYDPDSFDAACVNPPFNRCSEVVQALLEIVKVGGLVCVLQRTQLFEGKARYAGLFRSRQLRRFYQFVSRINFYPEGRVDHRIKGQMTYGWFIFEVGFSGRYEGDFIVEEAEEMGYGALLPQQAGMCEWCTYRDSEDCIPEVAPRKIVTVKGGKETSRAGQLPAKRVEWLRANTEARECGTGAGQSLTFLCLNWRPRL